MLVVLAAHIRLVVRNWSRFLVGTSAGQGLQIVFVVPGWRAAFRCALSQGTHLLRPADRPGATCVH